MGAPWGGLAARRAKEEVAVQVGMLVARAVRLLRSWCREARLVRRQWPKATQRGGWASQDGLCGLWSEV